LKSKGIRNTKEFFEWVQVDDQRKEMAGKTGIPSHRLLELFSLCDLSRITGVGGTFARVIYESGIRSTVEFAEITTADFATDEDIRYCVGYAKIIVECGRKKIQL
jgi:predicted flap endonuclease-1-like 5' DNA nuclease